MTGSCLAALAAAQLPLRRLQLSFCPGDLVLLVGSELVASARLSLGIVLSLSVVQPATSRRCFASGTVYRKLQ